MTHSVNGTYADLGPTQEELDALADVLDEIRAEELGDCQATTGPGMTSWRT